MNATTDQVPGGSVREYGRWRKHCPQCCSERECVHDGSVCGPEDSSVLVGKPGSSKSLAKSIVADSMRGQASQDNLLKSFKQVHMFSYQCSQLSTPQSVIEVFNTAQRFQIDQDITKYVSVVCWMRVGLAEDSPNLPLKALHPLLEDGTEGSDESDEVLTRDKRVAFIGLSNWALDPAKMNRGVMVTRGDPDINELVLSAQGICQSETNVKEMTQ
ncbi:E3 ubiquitin-protein ligase RNF213 [Geodia barretti]|uniref:E3 ubiquitin-protein ligase RNF213 n=1 Tax=Geodia barretti TaxID=519541 RepID=A0AA35RBI8_GEOBA|nr:E3 ubiquitin-protein ligase RNF213 [Geodia barretti]